MYEIQTPEIQTFQSWVINQTAWISDTPYHSYLSTLYVYNIQRLSEIRTLSGDKNVSDNLTFSSDWNCLETQQLLST